MTAGTYQPIPPYQAWILPDGKPTRDFYRFIHSLFQAATGADISLAEFAALAALTRPPAEPVEDVPTELSILTRPPASPPADHDPLSLLARAPIESQRDPDLAMLARSPLPAIDDAAITILMALLRRQGEVDDLRRRVEVLEAQVVAGR